MFRVIIFSLIICSLASPMNVQGQSASDVKYAGMVVEFPQFLSITKYSIFRDTVYFYYQGEMILYSFSYTHETFKNEVLVDVKKSYEYFMTDQNTNKGLHFHSLNDTANRKWLLRDSLLAMRNIKDYKFQEYLKYDSLINSKSLSGSEKKEIYIPKSFYKGKINDSTYFIFSPRIKDIPFSLSPSLDSLHSLRLRKVFLVYNSKYNPETKSNIPKQVWTYELFQQEIPQKNKQNMIDFFMLAKKLFRENEIY